MKSRTLMPATGIPPCVTRPASRSSFRFLFVTFAVSVAAPGPTIERASTVPAGFGTPVPAAHGVQRDVQREEPTGDVTWLLTVKLALSNCAPFGDRPGVPAGTSDGPRHVSIFAAPSAVSAPVVADTYTGKSIDCPATVRCRSHTARWGPG